VGEEVIKEYCKGEWGRSVWERVDHGNHSNRGSYSRMAYPGNNEKFRV